MSCISGMLRSLLAALAPACVVAASAQAPGFSEAALDGLQDVDGVEVVSALGWGEARFAGASGGSYSAVDPATAESVMNLKVSEGSIRDLGKDGVLVSSSAAGANGWELGDKVSAEFAESGRHALHVVGVYDGKGWVTDDFVLSRSQQQAFAGPQLVSNALVTIEAGADKAEVQGAIAEAMDENPDAKVLDRSQYEKEASGFIDQLLTFMTVMLVFAVLIALLGIVNTLALSVFERTRELGMLRAIGMTRSQVRAMVRWESVVISLIGALSGAALGIGIGLAGSKSLQFWGVSNLSVPSVQVLVYVALAALAGVLAAIGPARTAAKVDVLKAVVSD